MNQNAMTGNDMTGQNTVVQEPVTVVFASNDGYVPYLYVAVSSLINHVVPTRNYELYILHTDISDGHQKDLCALSVGNVSVQCIDIRRYSAPGDLFFTNTSYFRLFIQKIFLHHPKVIYIDADLVVLEDIAKLYDIDLGSNLLGACIDFGIQLSVNKDHGSDIKLIQYLDSVVQVRDEYINAGVAVFNLKAMQGMDMLACARDVARTHPTLRYLDQDILNIIFRKKICLLEASWNVLYNINRLSDYGLPHTLYELYTSSRQQPKIVHYAGGQKPWNYPGLELADHFWETARTTKYYDEIVAARIARLHRIIDTALHHNTLKLASLIYRLGSKILPGKMRQDCFCKYRHIHDRFKQLREYVEFRDVC